MNFYDTIAALSSPVGKGGVAVIRISGTEAFEIAERVFRAASGKSVAELKPNMMTYGWIISEENIIIEKFLDYQLFANVLPNNAFGSDVEWLSSNPSVVTVDEVYNFST